MHGFEVFENGTTRPMTPAEYADLVELVEATA